MFVTIGCQRATVNDIVSASGLPVGTFYNHYGDKDTIFSELLTGFLMNVRVTLKEARQSATSLESFVKGAFLAYSQLISQYPKMQRMISKNAPVFKQVLSEKEELREIIDDLSRDMELAVDAGIVPKFPVSMMTSAIIASSIDIFSVSDEEFSAQEKVEFLGNLFIGGIERMVAK